MVQATQIIGLGPIVVDHVDILPFFPEENQKIHVDEDFTQVGGPVPTAVMYSHHLGNSVRSIGAVGDDSRAGFVLHTLVSAGIDINDLVQQRGKASGFAHVWVNRKTGTRTVASRHDTLDPLPDIVTDAHLDGAALLHVTAREKQATIPAMEKAQKKGLTVTMDIGDMQEDSLEYLKHASIAICPRRFAEALTGNKEYAEAAKHIRTLGPHTVIITYGEHGLWSSSPEGDMHIPAFSVKTIDTTGAGDIFCGAFIHCLIEKKPLKDSLIFASAAAALKTTKLGKKDLASKQDIEEFIKTHSPSA